MSFESLFVFGFPKKKSDFGGFRHQKMVPQGNDGILYNIKYYPFRLEVNN